jgi:tRNA threonylcarbamoyl adenosine modification protein (Sua5/YciO/YrdC/YwlC family)
MARYLEVHPEDPQKRLIRQVVDQLRAGAVIAYPTDSSYALGCHIGDKNALDRLRRVRGLDDKHDFALVCRDVSEAATYAKLGNVAFRLVRGATPGPYTFILKATRETPRRLQDPKRKTVGIRVPDNAIALAILEELGEPVMSTTLILPGDEQPMSEGYEIQDRLDKLIDVIVDGGACGLESTTIVDLVGDEPEVLRVGKGDVGALGL